MRRHSRRWPTVMTGVLVCVTFAAGASALAVARLTSPLRPAIGAAGVGEGPLPVVLVAGVMSRGASFARLTATLKAEGTPVLDFDHAASGTQPFTYHPRSESQHVGDLAATMLQPAIEDALARAGYDRGRQHVDIVAHSVGGLLARFLVERPGGAVDVGWAERVDDLVMVGTRTTGRRSDPAWPVPSTTRTGTASPAISVPAHLSSPISGPGNRPARCTRPSAARRGH